VSESRGSRFNVYCQPGRDTKGIYEGSAPRGETVAIGILASLRFCLFPYGKLPYIQLSVVYVIVRSEDTID
jgi:hypothetical protein